MITLKYIIGFILILSFIYKLILLNKPRILYKYISAKNVRLLQYIFGVIEGIMLSVMITVLLGFVIIIII